LFLDQASVILQKKQRKKESFMDITYHGHSTFKLKGTAGVVVTDPYDNYIGLTLPSLAADVVTVSHQHKDHNAIQKVKGTARREHPFIIEEVGEYEVGGISIFGVKSYHDDHGGVERGDNIIFTIMIDDVRVCHLGDLGDELTAEQLADIGPVDVVICPVGGVFTIDPQLAVKTIHALEPSYALAMHYKTPLHEEKVFGEMKTIEDFVRAYGAEAKPMEKLQVTKQRLPEETELVILSIT
jgi:L-ascorbate metabolism protein UlaG (beta-lactamase superfamily)